LTDFKIKIVFASRINSEFAVVVTENATKLKRLVTMAIVNHNTSFRLPLVFSLFWH